MPGAYRIRYHEFRLKLQAATSFVKPTLVRPPNTRRLWLRTAIVCPQRPTGSVCGSVSMQDHVSVVGSKAHRSERAQAS